MLVIIRSMKELSFGKLMEVYSQENQKNAAQCYPQFSMGQALIQAEQDFYNYLNTGFFKTAGAVYCIWQEGDRYVSALRLEPYRDGLLLAALETAADRRNQGCAKQLVHAVLRWLGDREGIRVYSHISNDNPASIAVHDRCGFKKILNHAVYLDGSVSNRAKTYLYET